MKTASEAKCCDFLFNAFFLEFYIFNVDKIKRYNIRAKIEIKAFYKIKSPILKVAIGSNSIFL